jgi:hypothetical protein
LFNKNVQGLDTFHTLHYFIPVEVATFNILWLYSAFGLYIIIKKALYKNAKNTIIGLALFFATLPALLWPFFYIRILFIQYLLILPLSLFGMSIILEKTKSSSLKIITILLPIVLNFIFFFLANGKSLFDVLHL